MASINGEKYSRRGGGHRQSPGLRAANFILNTADKAAVGVARMATKDRFGTVRRLAVMPKMGFIDSLKYTAIVLATHLVAGIVCAVLTGLLIAFGMPFLISAIFR